MSLGLKPDTAPRRVTTCLCVLYTPPISNPISTRRAIMCPDFNCIVRASRLCACSWTARARDR